MKRNRIIATAATLIVAAGTGGWLYRRADSKAAVSYKLAPVERATVQSTVAATGTLSAVRTVQVGTQASGQISAIYVDFNDHVHKGQLLARIDPVLQQQAVEDAQAQLEKANAQYIRAKADYDREKSLYDSKIVTAAEFDGVRATYAVAQSTVKSAQITLNRAKQNLGYTTIYSPIDGVIIERDVDVGQTVAASFSAPQLFLIANDLSNMQILASVDESDIGQIKEGQTAQFTVQSYPNQNFDGTVQQVRLQSKTADNVVNYTAVVAVHNDGRLLPGMTATVKFQTAVADSVLTVPNAALRYTPTAAELATADTSGLIRQKPDSAQMAAFRARMAAQGGGFPFGGGRGAGAQRPKSTSGTLWYLKNGRLTAMRVRIGLTDGSKTQVMGKDLTQGMQIIAGVNVPGATGSSTTSNPLGPQQQQRGPRGPGGF